jgi:hypothetical protein
MTNSALRNESGALRGPSAGIKKTCSATLSLQRASAPEVVACLAKRTSLQGEASWERKPTGTFLKKESSNVS